MKLFGGILPFIGWRKYQLTTSDMKEEMRRFLRENPDLEDTTIMEDMKYGIENADIYIFETFEVEFLEFKLIQSIRERTFVRFSKFDKET